MFLGCEKKNPLDDDEFAIINTAPGFSIQHKLLVRKKTKKNLKRF